MVLMFSMSCTDTLETSTIDGKKVDLSKGKSALVWLAPDCPLCQSYSASFVELKNQYGDQISFYGVIPGNYYSKNEIDFFIDSFAFTPDIIADKDFKLTQSIGATVTPEFFLLDSGMQVKYRGKFDDWATDLSRKKLKPTKHYFKNAIEALSIDSPISIQSTTPIGCVIEFE